MPKYLARAVALLCCAAFLSHSQVKPTLPQAQVDTDLAHTPVTGKSITVSVGQDLQAAINSASPGDELVLQAGVAWTGNYTLPAKTGTGWVTIRSSAIAKLPIPGNRVSPNDAVNMPMIVAAGVGTAFHLDPKANHYRLIGLEITEQPKQSLNYGLIMQGDPNDANAADLPSYIILDRCYLHGRPLSHIKFGWQMNGANLAIIDSYVSEFHGLGQDTQAITGYMGPGPVKISNNYLSAAGENVLFGGAYDAIPNTTTADVTVTGNYLYKPPAWYQSSLIPAPTAVLATPSTAAGSLATGTYYYAVIAAGTLGTLDSLPGQAQSFRSAEASVTVPSGQSAAAVNWTEASYGDAADTRLADNYIVCRTTDAPNASSRAWTYFAVTPAPGAKAVTFVDIGTAPALSGFGEWPRQWSVKNLFEIKNGVRWLVDGNVMEGNWVSSQNGYAVLFTPRQEPPNMYGNCVTDITFQNNIVRHVAGGVNIGSEDDITPLANLSAALVTSRIALLNNLFEDVGYTYGNNGVAMQFGAGPYATLPGVQDLLFDHNTFFQSWSHAALGPADVNHPENKIGAFRFSNNVLAAGAYDWHFNGGGYDWTGSILPNFTSITTNNNVWAGAPWNAQYPANNMFPADLNSAGFVNYSGGNGGDYHLTSTSPYKGKASDGTDPGANMDVLNTVAVRAVSGQTAGSTPITPPPVTTPPVVVPPVIPPVTPPTPTLWFSVINRNSGKCVTTQTGSTMAQFACSAANLAQLFSLIPSFDANNILQGYQVYAQGAKTSWDVWGASTANGAVLGLYPFQNSANELFTLKPDGKRNLTIVAKHSGSCADIAGASTLDGAKLQQHSCNGTLAQSFDLQLISIQ